MPEIAGLTELAELHQALGRLRSCVVAIRGRYGDIPAVKRLVGDVDRMDIDASELDTAPAPLPESRPEELEVLTDEPIDPLLWADADDEGVGGYHRGPAQ